VIVERESEIIGAVGFSAMSIRPGDSAVAIGIGDLPIAAASHFVNLMESAAIAAIGEYLETGETTRITTVDLEVLDAVAIGTEIRATATCTEISARVSSVKFMMVSAT
jgi:fluoroacetyl-CoA thioesterase